MLAIRMQRIGRKGYAQYRVVVQDSRLTPTSGRVVATIGHYNPHTKVTTLEKDEAQKYLKNGAQPSERVTRLLLAEGVKLPSWVEKPDSKAKRSTKNPDKLRKNQPAEAEVPEEKEPVAEVEPAAEEAAATEVPATEEAETKNA